MFTDLCLFLSLKFVYLFIYFTQAVIPIQECIYTKTSKRTNKSTDKTRKLNTSSMHCNINKHHSEQSLYHALCKTVSK